jgi:peptidoglycan/xylan/chitin deacetylase (PgdA/CDA1 family)
MTTPKTVLAYHGVGACPNPVPEHDCLCMPPEVFARQMDFLARHRTVVALDALLAEDAGARPGHDPRDTRRHRPQVAITFDDGYRNLLEHAAPVLRRHGFPATVFVPTRWIGADNRWDVGRSCHPLAIMDDEELRFAEGLGIRVESHGHDHVDLADVPPRQASDDLLASVDRLSEILGRRPRYVAYPYGGQNAAVRAEAEAAGFSGAFGFNTPDEGLFGRERVSMDGLEGRVRLHLKTAGGYLSRRHSPVGTAAAWVLRRLAPRPGSAGGVDPPPAERGCAAA